MMNRLLIEMGIIGGLFLTSCVPGTPNAADILRQKCEIDPESIAKTEFLLQNGQKIDISSTRLTVTFPGRYSINTTSAEIDPKGLILIGYGADQGKIFLATAEPVDNLTRLTVRENCKDPKQVPALIGN